MRFLYPLILAAPLTLVLPAFPQAMTEHAAAIAGAAVGAGAGKSVSDGLTKIFGEVDDTAGKAAAQKKKPTELKKEDKKEAPTVAASSRGGAAHSGPAASGPFASTAAESSPSPSRHATASIGPQPQAPAIAEESVITPPTAKEPVLTDLLGIKPGTKKDSLTSSLGEPSSQITIPDEGHLVEILRYTANGQMLGVVRLENGEVVSVEAAGAAR